MNQPSWLPLLRLLADGAFHSGEQLAAELGCSRAAIWKQLRPVRELPGIRVDSVRGRGYRITPKLALLSTETLLDKLTQPQRDQLEMLHVATIADSTNAMALAQLPTTSGRAKAWFAEHQTAGRGRRGRQWISTFGNNIYLSIAWRFDLPMSRLAGLSLAIGASVAKLLADHGLQGHGLKWPNDLLYEQRKLGGILVEVSGEAQGPVTAVIGIGLNLDMPRDQAVTQAIDQPWVTLNDAGIAPDRSDLAAGLLGALLDACCRFSSEGLAGFLPDWERYELYRGEPVRLQAGKQSIDGAYIGVAPDGGLVVRTAAGTQRFYSGEVSLRRREMIA